MAKSKKRIKKLNLLNKTSSWIFTHKLVIALVAIIVFGGTGAWLISQSRASTTQLTQEQCYNRGRTGKWTTLYEYTCYSACIQSPTSSGEFRPNPDGYGYCSLAISKDISKEVCDSVLHRDYIGSLGCARSWKQKVADQDNALQCRDNTKAYHVRSPHDYCGKLEAGSTTTGWVWPVPSTTSLGTLAYGETGSKGVHKGIDIGISGGASLDKPVVAAHAGVVDRVWGQSDGCGAYVSIKASGEGTAYYAAYQHLNGGSIAVKAGDTVTAGQLIGKIGKQGGSSCGSSGFYHLHFSIETKAGMVSTYADSFPNGTINPCSVLAEC